MKLLIILLLLFQVNVFAETKSLHFSTYDEAASAKDFLRFDMESTKAGLITTSFTGFVKNVEMSYQEDSHFYREILVKFKSRDLDTNVNARNEKMWDKCFSSELYPELSLHIPLIEKGKSTDVEGHFTVRGETFPVRLQIQQVDLQKVQGHAEFSLKELKIPDPSIYIAKVNDKIKVSFSLSK